MFTREKATIFWFRRDLRLYDNIGLSKALEEKHPVLPIFIFDNNILEDLEARDDSRVEFLYNRISGMHHTLKEEGSGILILIGDPIDVFKKLSSELNISSVYTNRDYEPYAKRRDSKIGEYLRSAGIEFYDFKDQVIFEEDEVVKDDGLPYHVFTPYKRNLTGNR